MTRYEVNSWRFFMAKCNFQRLAVNVWHLHSNIYYATKKGGGSMLVARNEQGDLVYSMRHSRQELQQLQQMTAFFCPQCQAPVQLKLGAIITPHFAHKNATSCTKLFSEGESAAHLAGKIQLYEWLQQRNIFVMLEPTIEGVTQRPDLLVVFDEQEYALEFQCSTISASVIKKRSEGYRAVGITPVWIFKAPTFASYQAVIQQRISKMYQAGAEEFILFYAPQTKTFTYASHLYRLYNDQFIVRLSRINLTNQHFPFYKPAPLTEAQRKYYASCYQHANTHLLSNCLRFPRQPQAIRLRACAADLRCAMIDLTASIPCSLPHTLGADMIWQSELRAYSKQASCDIVDIEPHAFLQTYRYPITDANVQMLSYYCHEFAKRKLQALTELFAFS